MKTVQRSFKFSPVASAIAMALAAQFPIGVAYANSGFGDGVNLGNSPVKLATFYANSPSGPAPLLDPATGLTIPDATTRLPTKASSGKALRKFVDTLPGLNIPGVTLTKRTRINGVNTTVPATANNLGQYIPVAVAEKWVDLNGSATGDDYMEIAAVEYTQQMHSDLLHPTRLRGYVQLMTPGLLAKGLVAKAFTTLDGQLLSVVDLPHHLGPVIHASSGTALRIKFVNKLPAGAGGKLFVPVDRTVTGAGTGPDGVTPYSQNRAVMHLVGGGLPWISAGTPHQWIAPAGETNPGVDPVSGQHGAVLDARGVSNHNVPDMADPGPGATTLYFPNDMSARFMFYHDRSSGLSRLNAYAGMEAGYFVSDSTEQALITAGTIPGAADTIPLIIEDKTFVPADVAQQDAKWNKSVMAGAAPMTVLGGESDLWFPHVYETNQDPASALGTNPVGRFDYGPLFWPIFPAVDPTPTGYTDDATIVPTAYLDTPVINGTAYPTLTVDPKAYRFRILNASGDRYLNLGLYKADTTAGLAPMLDANGNPIFNAAGTQQFFSGTEVKLVAALAADALGNPPTPVSLDLPYDPACLCQYPALARNNNVESSGPTRAWPIDSRRGGVPDPLSVGPDIIAIGNDGGFLPNPVDIPSQPITFEANRRSITVNNAYGYGLLLGPAERSDAIIDFSKYAGQTLIVYNDAPAPFPFSDERNDYYTGNPDLTGVGGAYPTKPGYGPNTRTLMQIKVNAAAVAATGKFDPAALVTALPAAYAAKQVPPLVPAVAYNRAFGTNDPDIYAHIATGAASQPTLDFTTTGVAALTLNTPTLITSGGTVNAGGIMVYNSGSGSGYDPMSPPRVVFNNTVNGTSCLNPSALLPLPLSASATATVDPITHQVNGITNFQAGAGYTCLPTVSFVNTAPVTSIALVNGGSGYTNPVVTISGGGGTGASATATLDANGSITGFANIVRGSGYSSIPSLEITDAGGTGSGALANAVLSSTLGVGAQVAVTASGGKVQSLKILPMTEQELFDNRGRYNYTGGVEMPFTNAINQTTVPLNYIDAATEAIADGETQVWKITVNGLFSNNLSFNLADVQLINRVGWDGTVKPPSSNELGWKNTVRLNPLEDLLVAVRARRANVPFGLPRSARAQDPSKKVGASGSEMGFTMGQGVPELSSAVNRLMDYDNEFFWNSALLSNSENDFMRTIVFSPNVVLPAAPTDLSDPLGDGTLTWIDPTPAGQLAAPLAAVPLAATLANPQNEIGFKILQATLAAGLLSEFAPAKSAAGVPVTLPANTTRWTQPLPLDPSTVYAVVAYNAAGDSLPSIAFAQTIPLAPTVLTADFTADPSDAPTLVNFYNAVTLSWNGGTSSNKLDLYRTDLATGVTTLVKTMPGTATGYVDKGVTALKSYRYQILATNALQPVAVGAAISAALEVSTPMIPVTAPAVVTAVSNNQGTAITLKWTDSARNETAYQVDVSLNGDAFVPVSASTPTMSRTATQGTATSMTTNVTLAPNFVSAPGNSYVFRVTAINVTGGATSTSTPSLSPVVDLTIPTVSFPVTMVLTPGAQTATRAPFSWTAVAAPATVSATAVSYVVQVNTNAAVDAAGALVWTNAPATAALYANPAIAAGNSYQFRVVPRTTRYGLTVLGTPSDALTVVTPPAASTSPVAAAVGSSQIMLNWTNPSSDITSWIVQRRPNFGASRVYGPITVTVNGAAPSYTVTDTVPALGSYTYRINAVNAQGTGATATSNTVTVK